MPTLPKYERKEIPGVVSLPRADPGAMTQDLGARARMGSALTQTGFALTDVGIKFQQKLQEAEVESQVQRAKDLDQGSYNEWMRELTNRKEIDPNKALADYNTVQQQNQLAIKQTLTHAQSNRLYDLSYRSEDIIRRKEILSLVDKNRTVKVTDDTELSLKNAINDLDMESYDEILNKAVFNNVYTEGKAGQKRLDAEKEVNINIVNRDGLIDPVSTLERLKSGQYKIDPKSEVTLMEKFVGVLEKQEKDGEKLRQHAEDEGQKRVIDLIEKGSILEANEWITLYSDKRIFDSETRTVLTNMIKKQDDESDKSTLEALGDRVLDPSDSVSNITIIKTKGVGYTDKLALLKVNAEQPNEKRKTFEYKEVYDSLRNEISPRGPMGQLDVEKESRWTACKRALDKAVKDGIDPWEFYDKNLYKYQLGVPNTLYGKPRTVDDILRMKAALIDDIDNNRITVEQANMEADKIKYSEEYLNNKQGGLKKDAGTRR